MSFRTLMRKILCEDIGDACPPCINFKYWDASDSCSSGCNKQNPPVKVGALCPYVTKIIDPKTDTLQSECLCYKER